MKDSKKPERRNEMILTHSIVPAPTHVQTEATQSPMPNRVALFESSKVSKDNKIQKVQNGK